MRKNGFPRLYQGPRSTIEVLRAVVKGNTTQEELADAMDVGERTVHNRVHDPTALGLLGRENGEYTIRDQDDVMKFFQLEDRTVLKERFVELPAVSEILDELNGGQMSTERIGRLIAFHTDSKAIDSGTFKTYGRVYANWIDYLRLGFAGNETLYSEKPPDTERNQRRGPKDESSGYPKVRPELVFEALPMIDAGIESSTELAEHFDFSDSYASKLLSTCYSLGIAEKDAGDVVLTEFGEKVLRASDEERKQLIRDALWNVNLVQEYCELAPNEEFRNQELMAEVNDEYDKGWSESTVSTKAKRLYQWFIYSGLFVEVKKGILIPHASSDGSQNGDGQESMNRYV
ncbi:AAA-associated domain-containing protein [Halorubrum xinjiangense]|nr:AAA-associated domain-containing protein [Halorubrum xinjiangense]